MDSRFRVHDNESAGLLKRGLSVPEIVATVLGTDKSRRESTDVDTFRRYLVRNKRRLLDECEGVYEALNSIDVPITDAKHLWIKNKNVTAYVTNKDYVDDSSVKVEDIDFKAILGNVKPVKYKEAPKLGSGCFDRLVYTDTHVGMLITDYSLYGGVWDETELDLMCEKMIEGVISTRKSNILHIDDLGDFLDGYDAQTVRRGHHLPQNMDNQKAFDVGLRFKLKLVQSLLPYYDEIICHNVCEDNHAGSFGYILNSAFKTAIEMMSDKVRVVNIRKFMDYYTQGKYTFVLCHGKDSVSLKFGFKPKLDKIQENKIDNYLDRNNLKGSIEFSKGDSHQYLFDTSTAQRFNYYNYPALSPSSSWVQVNFQQGIRGFVIFNYYDDRKVINEFIYGK